MMDKLKTFFDIFKHLRVRQIIRLLICAVCIVIYVVLTIWMNLKVSELDDQLVSKRWNSEGGFGQASIFFSQGTTVTEDKIKEFEYRISKALTEDSVDDGTDDNGDTTANWTDCYSSVGSITASVGTKSVEATAIGTGGDFFIFHPVTLLSGSYYDDDDLMNDRIVIDENLAWQLYGSNDIIGQTIEIGGVPHIIAGVTRFDNSKMIKASGIEGPVCFLSYYSLYNYGTVYGASTGSKAVATTASATDKKTEDTSTASTATSDPGAISCYEVVMPNPVEGYARSVLAGKLGMKENNIFTVDNDKRFGPVALLNVLNAFPTRSMRTFNITFPYWENIARGWEDILAICLAIRFICVLIVVAILVYKIVYSYNHKKWTIESVSRYISDRIYDIQSSLKYEKDKWKYF